MNRPDTTNALNGGLITQLPFFINLNWPRDVRVVVLGVAGNVFCAGLEIKRSEHFGEGVAASLKKRKPRHADAGS